MDRHLAQAHKEREAFVQQELPVIEQETLKFELLDYVKKEQMQKFKDGGLEPYL